eukprot:4494436-Amphidinium_carterae.1
MEAGYGDASSKKPPAWNAEQRQYRFVDYVRDVRLWAAATDLRASQIGPALALRLSGEARDVVRDLDPLELSNGRIMADGSVVTGAELLLQELATRFGPMAQHHAISSLEEFMNFKRSRNESADRTIARFNDLFRRAVRDGG